MASVCPKKLIVYVRDLADLKDDRKKILLICPRALCTCPFGVSRKKGT